MFKVGVDVGGTFTDLVVLDGQTLRIFKTPTTPDVTEGLINVLQKAARTLGLSFPDFMGRIALCVHGTTIGTNTMLEGSGARVGLLATEGFRDSLAIRRGKREYLWDFRKAYPPPIVPRYLRLGVRERIDKNGEVLFPLSRESLEAALSLFRKEKVEAIAVCFLNSYLNPVHEAEAESAARAAFPGAFITSSAKLIPVMGEYERTSTAVIDAYVGPKTSQYLLLFAERLKEQGLTAPLYLVQSNGGLTGIQTAARRPSSLILSGPAAGAPASLFYGRLCGTENLIFLDMGGTSCDVTLIRSGVPALKDETRVAGYDLALPSIDINTIGAGGGTIAFIDKGGMLKVGPRSAGASPGPVCYGKGGGEATITDANLILGRLNPDYFLGGEIGLDPQKARAIVGEKIAAPLRLSGEQAALGIIRIANEMIVSAVKKISIERGQDPRNFTLVAGGGAGPLQACEVSAALGIREVYVAREAAASCAFGMLITPVRHHYIQSIYKKLRGLTIREFTSWVAALKERARAENPRPMSFSTFLDLRYRGQQWKLEVEAGEDGFQVEKTEEAFHRRHEALYGFRREYAPVETQAIKLIAEEEMEEFSVRPAAREGKGSVQVGEREIITEGGKKVLAPCYRGSSLLPGLSFQGPSIIEEETTTLYVPSGWKAGVDEYGNYRLRRES
jgi:N-methylhydantoinase A